MPAEHDRAAGSVAAAVGSAELAADRQLASRSAVRFDRAEARLGHVHLDDNDSVGDLHWPLLTGRLTQDMLEALLTMLALGDYQGALTLELSPTLADPMRALGEGAALVRRLAQLRD